MRFGTFVKKIRLRGRKIVYYKMLLAFIFSMTIPLLLISFLAVRYSTDHIIKQSSYTSSILLSEKSEMIEQRMQEFDKIMNQYISSNQIWSLMSYETIQPQHYFVMFDIIKLFRNTIANNELIHSIYFFDNYRDFVLAEAKYSKSDFYDTELLQENTDSRLLISNPRMVKNNKVISYQRRFDSFAGNHEFYIIINIDYDKLFKSLIINDYYDSSHLMILNQHHNFLYSNVQEPLGIEASLSKAIKNMTAESDVANVEGNKYFISKKDSEFTQWIYIYLQEYESLVQESGLLRRTIFISFAVVFFFASIAIIFIASHLYKPLENLVQGIKKYSVQLAKPVKNEYKIINTAINNLVHQKNELDTKLEFTFPYFQQYFIQSFIVSSSFDKNKFNNVLSAIGVRFEYSKYVLALMDFENRMFTMENNRTLEALLSGYSDKLSFVISGINKNRGIVIINTEEDILFVHSVLLKIKEQFNISGLELTISLGNQFEDLDYMMESYETVLQQMENKFFIKTNELLFDISMFNTGDMNNITYKKEMEEILINYIKSQDSLKACKYIREIGETLKNECDSIDYQKYTYFQIYLNIIYVLMNIGIHYEMEIDSKSIFQQIKDTDTLEEVHAFFDELIYKSIYLIKGMHEKQHKDIIKKAVEFIDENFNKDLSIDIISNNVYLSPGYLSNIFKEEMGMTIFEYITRLRMESAKNMLLSSNAKVEDISQTVGYNNVQSFLRFFKKQFNMTPMQLRRKYMLDS